MMIKVKTYSNFLFNKPEISVGAKHSGRYLFAENIKLSTAWASPYRGSAI